MHHHLSWFSQLARATAHAAGQPVTFAVSVGIILAWAVTGPIFHFSDTWQLFINTGTTIVTFLMVFLLQHSQNHDTAAIQLKLNELIRAVHDAKNAIIEADQLDDEHLARLQKEYLRLAAKEEARASRETPS